MFSLLVVAGGALLVALVGEVVLMTEPSRGRVAARPCGSVAMQPQLAFWQMDRDGREGAP